MDWYVTKADLRDDGVTYARVEKTSEGANVEFFRDGQWFRTHFCESFKDARAEAIKHAKTEVKKKAK